MSTDPAGTPSLVESWSRARDAATALVQAAHTIGADHPTAVPDHPQMTGGIDRWMTDQRVRDAEREVVTSLVSEQERFGEGEPLAGIVEAKDLHPGMLRDHRHLDRRD